MTRFRVVLVVLTAAVLAVPTGAQRRSDAAVMLEAARQKAAIDGDLRGAIDAYRQVVERHAADHAAVATAWLRMADLYETLGDAGESTRVLERVLALADQPEAVAVARGRLGGGQGEGDRPGRTVIVNSRTLNVEYPAVSPDGKLLAFTDYINANANLMVRDLATGIDRQVTTDAEAPGKEVLEKAFSRDGRYVAYSFDFSELRLVDLAANGPAEPRVLLKNDETIAYVVPYDWSADGKRIAVSVSSRQRSDAVGFVTVDDGQFHVVRSLDWRGSTRVSISPDGAYLAYDRRPDDNSEPDVYVVSSDGSREVLVARTDGRDAVVGWSADGRHLLYTSDRDGANSLFAQPMRSGRPNGRAVLLRKDVALRPAGLTTSGDVYFEVDPSTSGIYVASADLKAGKLEGPLSRSIDGERPTWSPDSTALAYANMGTTRRRNVIAVRTLRDGKTRSFTLKDLTYVQGFEWTSDGRAIIARGQDRQGRPGLFRIDPRTGEVATITLQGPPRPGSLGPPMAWGTDSVAYMRIRTNQPGRMPGIREAGPDAPKLFERDLTTGEERQLFDFSNEPWATFGLSASPDRRFLAAMGPRQGDAPSGLYRQDPTSFVVLHTLATGESRRIWTAPFGQAFSGSVEWLPDGSAVIVTKLLEQGAGRREAWIVPIDGSEPRKLDLGIQNLLRAGVRVSPDGRSLAIIAGDNRDSEVQVFERLVPGARR